MSSIGSPIVNPARFPSLSLYSTKRLVDLHCLCEPAALFAVCMVPASEIEEESLRLGFAVTLL